MILSTEPLDLSAGSSLQGELFPPGDKSISHRALIMASLARGQSRIQGLLDGEDVKATANACRQLGMSSRRDGNSLLIDGVGSGGLKPPGSPLDMGNSGTAMRLLAGVLSAQAFSSTLLGDPSLSSRPMRRIVHPLSLMGARIQTSRDGTPPLLIEGNPELTGISYDSPVASAQVKSCVLLAGLYARGRTRVREPRKSRDHTEKMLPTFGVAVGEDCSVAGGSELSAAQIRVPGDISSATFFLVAAAMIPGSDLLLRNVGMNETRDGILHVLRAMGADLNVDRRRMFGEEAVGDIRIRYSRPLKGIDVPVEWIPSLIDELPAIMALASVSGGLTRIRGAEELRVKESDRIAVMAKGLAKLGVRLKEYPDGIDIEGGTIGGGAVDGAGDHRCAMSFCVLGQLASGPVSVAGSENIDTSYPGFVRDLAAVGGNIFE
jgi:3-phosphoshikimate 1-carboxyvinyltransferase